MKLIRFIGMVFFVSTTWSGVFAKDEFETFDGPIRFKGIAKGAEFIGVNFRIKEAEGLFHIIGKNPKIEFVAIPSDMRMHDIASSSNGKIVVLSMASRKVENFSRSILVIDSSGVSNKINYKAYDLTDKYDWIEEIAAISDNGVKILAKCARMVESDAGHKIVNHDWAILSLGNGEIKSIETDNVFSKWPH